MDYEKSKRTLVDVDGHIATGKQFDVEIKLPEDDRGVIYGIIKDSCNEPVKDAVVKLIEVCKKDYKNSRKPVSHTFTDEEGEFVFGPLCEDREYEIQVWADRVKHVKVCAECHRKGKCLKGVDMDKCDSFIGSDKDDDCKCCKCCDDKECDCKKDDDKKCDDKKDDCKKDDDKKCDDKKDYCKKN